MKNLENKLIMAEASEGAPTTASYATLSPVEFSAAIANPDVNLIDVRRLDEYSVAHIKGARNIDVTQPDFLDKAKAELPLNKTVAVYCGSGKRSAMASEKLAAAGYKVLNLDGGITNWQEQHLPVTA